jgi:hypothetical protein
MKQYVPLNKYGLKVFTGAYTSNLSVYVGKKAHFIASSPTNVVLKLLGSLLGCGRKVVTAITQVLNSPTLFLIMTHILGHCIKRGKEIHMKLSMQN